MSGESSLQKAQIDRTGNAGIPMPEHVAIIMDGNGRWAQARGLPRTQGHRKGVEAVRAAVRAAGELGIKTLTLFSFSSENWARPAEEVNDLMGLLKLFIRRDLADLHRENVKISIIGARDNIPGDILPLLEEAENLTKNNTNTRLVIAFNYGSRDEITRSCPKNCSTSRKRLSQSGRNFTGYAFKSISILLIGPTRNSSSELRENRDFPTS